MKRIVPSILVAIFPYMVVLYHELIAGAFPGKLDQRFGLHLYFPHMARLWNRRDLACCSQHIL